MTYDFFIHSKDELIQAVQTFGIVPYFSNPIPGFSLEERCDPRVLWSDTGDNSWAWKGPVIQSARCAYGKFFFKKAAYVSLDVFLDLANYRRDGYDFDARFEDGLAKYKEQYLYNIIASRHSILSKDAKAVGGYIKPKVKGPDQWEPRKGFDTSITKLQMQCYVLTSDFEYEIDRNGNFYGWGIARYATPEEFYGKYFTSRVYKRTPEESFRKILKHMKKILPDVPEEQLIRFLR
jgi:hypothetical protein